MTKILLIDDDTDLLAMVTLMLKTQGFDVRSSEDAGRVLAMIDEFKPDLLIMDIFLGNYNGMVICREVKETEAAKTLPVILYSAGTIPQAEILQSGADAFLAKPFKMAGMIGLVKEMTASKAV